MFLVICRIVVLSGKSLADGPDAIRDSHAACSGIYRPTTLTCPNSVSIIHTGKTSKNALRRRLCAMERAGTEVGHVRARIFLFWMQMSAAEACQMVKAMRIS